MHGIRSSGLRIHESHFARSFLFFPPIYRQDILRTPLNRRPTFRENASPPLFPSIIAGSMGMRAYNTGDFTLNQPFKYEVIYQGIYFTEYIKRGYTGLSIFKHDSKCIMHINSTHIK